MKRLGAVSFWDHRGHLKEEEDEADHRDAHGPEPKMRKGKMIAQGAPRIPGVDAGKPGGSAR